MVGCLTSNHGLSALGNVDLLLMLHDHVLSASGLQLLQGQAPRLEYVEHSGRSVDEARLVSDRQLREVASLKRPSRSMPAS